MVFRRRPRPWWQAAREALWPRGGWRRAGEYVRHRLRRLPDSPEKIGRGMAAGVFTAFTPFFGVHFVVALLLARLVRGNYVASLVGTFAFNPLTAVPIAAAALWIGHRLTGGPPDGRRGEGPGGPGDGRPGGRGGDGPDGDGPHGGIGRAFADAWAEMWHNLRAPFTPAEAHWDGLSAFMDDVFLPYLLGGVLPGLLAALAAYWATVPAARAWQAARRRQLAERLARLRPPGAPDTGNGAGSGAAG